jgi:hypothetical protein
VVVVVVREVRERMETGQVEVADPSFFFFDTWFTYLVGKKSRIPQGHGRLDFSGTPASGFGVPGTVKVHSPNRNIWPVIIHAF